ncbi:hypothetical protein D3C86_1239990 [compost metagenome]
MSKIIEVFEACVHSPEVPVLEEPDAPEIITSFRRKAFMSYPEAEAWLRKQLEDNEEFVEAGIIKRFMKEEYFNARK